MFLKKLIGFKNLSTFKFNDHSFAIKYRIFSYQRLQYLKNTFSI